jgi:Ca-activated chloride channel family protein
MIETINFAEPQYLWLLGAPALLLLLWVWRLVRHVHDRRGFRRHRRLPVRERFTLFGGLLFWLCLTGATALTIVAMARPTAAVPLARTAGVDIVVLQAGSASMRVRDVGGDRWQRSVQFLRTLGESLRWKDDRIALALFAHVAEPQIRLTRDPNTYFFFLDHLTRESPFRLEDDPTWDTNIEQGIFWGLRLVDKDQELHGRSRNGKVFVLVSDGQVWSGEVARAMKLVREHGIPIFVVGVGTTSGGMIPDPKRDAARAATEVRPPAIHAVLDRDSLEAIAGAAGGQYLELGRETDREIANRIISATRRNAGSLGLESGARDLYWQCLLAAACLLVAGIVFMQERAELWLYTFGTAAALFAVYTVTR